MDKYFLKKFIAPNQYTLIGISALAAIMFFSTFLQRKVIVSGTDTFLSALINDYLAAKSPVLVSAIYTALAVTIALLIIKVNENYRFIHRPTIVPTFIFMFFITFSEYDVRLNAGLIGALFLLLAMNSFFVIFRHGNILKCLFDTFFILSVGSLFHIHLLFLSAVFLLFVFFSGSFNIRHLFAALIGFITPLVIVVPIIVGLGYGEEFLVYTNYATTLSYNVMQSWSFSRIFYSVFFFIVIIVSIAFFYLTNLREETRNRRTLFFIFMLTITLCVLGIYQMKNFFTYYPLFILCMSLCSGYYFSLCKAKYIRHLFAFFLATPVLFSIYSYLTIGQ